MWNPDAYESENIPCSSPFHCTGMGGIGESGRGTEIWEIAIGRRAIRNYYFDSI